MTDMVKSVAEENTNCSTDDYINETDGLLYCGKCHTPKQARVQTIKGPVPVKCRCEKAQAEKAQAEYDEAQRQKAITERKKNCFGSDYDIFKNHTFSNSNDKECKAYKFTYKYADYFADMKAHKLEKCGLILCGDLGTGKTYLAACVANAIIEQGYSCLMTNFSKAYNQYFSEQDKQSFIESFKTPSLLIIDDIAIQRDTPSMNELIYSIIDERYKVKKPILITTNLTLSEVVTPSDYEKRRIYNRLCELCYPFEVKGENRRLAHFAIDYKKMTEFYEA